MSDEGSRGLFADPTTCQVLISLLCQGRTRAECARAMGIASKTIRRANGAPDGFVDWVKEARELGRATLRGDGDQAAVESLVARVGTESLEAVMDRIAELDAEPPPEPRPPVLAVLPDAVEDPHRLPPIDPLPPGAPVDAEVMSGPDHDLPEDDPFFGLRKFDARALTAMSWRIANDPKTSETSRDRQMRMLYKYLDGRQRTATILHLGNVAAQGRAQAPSRGLTEEAKRQTIHAIIGPPPDDDGEPDEGIGVA